MADVNLDDTSRCPLSGVCEACGATADLAVVTAVALGGVLCLTLCPACDKPPAVGPATAALMVGAHCEHLGIDLEAMADQLDRERGAEQ